MEGLVEISIVNFINSLLYIGSLKSGGLTHPPPPTTSLMKILSVVNENLYLLNYFPIETILFS